MKPTRHALLALAPYRFRSNADPGCRATQHGCAIAVARDKLGFIVLHPSPA